MDSCFKEFYVLLSEYKIIESNNLFNNEYLQLINSELNELLEEEPAIICEHKYYNYIYYHLYNYFNNFTRVDDNKFNLSLIYVLQQNRLIRNYFCSYNYVNEYHNENIERIKLIKQPEQRTEEWYEFRYNHITASNAWKALSKNIGTQNQIIFEKCKPYVNKNYNYLIETPMSWGIKYEPLTIKIYEMLNETIIDEFGCIEHPRYSFLAASPDGIVTSNNNKGRMIEIKNVYTREINKNPKKEYYIQTQLQMEVCDIDECDFIETKFIEYESYEDFLIDGTIHKTVDNKYKGTIIVYIENNTNYYYEYLDLDIEPEKLEYKLNNIKNSETLVWCKNIFWKLDVYSCVLIPRCNRWFNDNIHQLQNVWNIIINERKTKEYTKRAPKSKKCLINSIVES